RRHSGAPAGDAPGIGIPDAPPDVTLARALLIGLSVANEGTNTKGVQILQALGAMPGRMGHGPEAGRSRCGTAPPTSRTLICPHRRVSRVDASQDRGELRCVATRKAKPIAPMPNEVPVTPPMLAGVRTEILRRIDQAREEAKADNQRLDGKIDAAVQRL